MQELELYKIMSEAGEFVRRYILAIIFFITGLIATTAVLIFYQNEVRKNAMNEFKRSTDVRIFQINNRLEETIEPINLIKKIYQTVKNLTPLEFYTLIDSTVTLYKDISLIGCINQQKTFPVFSFPFYPQQSLFFISPNNEKRIKTNYLLAMPQTPPLFFDFTAYPIFVDAFRKASFSNGIVSTPSVPFFHPKRRLGFFLMTSLHPEILPRNQNKILFALGDFKRIVSDHMSTTPQIQITILDKESNQRLFTTKLLDEIGMEEWEAEKYILMGDRTWIIRASAPSASFLDPYNPAYWIIFLAGTLLSTLAASYLLIMVNRGILIRKEVLKQTEELAEINHLLQLEVHERQRVEEINIQHQHLLQRRHETLVYLTKLTASELKNALYEVLIKTAGIFLVERTSVWFYEQKNGSAALSCAGLYEFSNNSFSSDLQLDSKEFPLYFRLLDQHTHLIFPSNEYPEASQELEPYLSTFKIISKLDIPIIFQDKLMGILSCEETRKPREWLLEDRHFGQNIADIISIMIEQAARRKAEKALLESEERLRLLTQKTIDAILTLNHEGMILSWNDGAEKMFGYKESEIKGQSINLILPYQDVLKSQESKKTVELSARDKSERLFPVEISHTRWKSGVDYFETVIIRDITDRKVNEKRLVKAMQAAKQANQAKNEFLTTISHELRTPLNAIIGFDQILLMGLDGPLTEQQTISLKKIEKSSFHLLTLINDILDLAKIEAKKIKPQFRTENIVELLVSSIDEIRPLADAKNLKIDLVLDKAYLLVEVDPIKIKQVLLNLLGNAVKFTEKGVIQIRLISHAKEIEIHVSDTGIGLTTDEIKKLFKPFSQADSSISRKYGGTGLGLAISKKIAQQHQGTLYVTSQKGIGSTFIMKLPRRRSK